LLSNATIASRKPGIVDFTLMESKLREYLDGKFFNVDGDDVNEIALNKKDEKKREIAMKMELRRQAALKKAARITAYGKLADMRNDDLTFEKIVAAVSYAHGVQMDDICSNSRFESHVLARHHVVWLARTLFNWSFPTIGSNLYRDHSSCQHAFKKWDAVKDRYPDISKTALAALGQVSDGQSGTGTAAELRQK
jgi:hypothetical protein